MEWSVNQSMDERQREPLKRTLSAGLTAVDPEKAVRSFLTRTGDNLQIGHGHFSLENFANIYLIGAGARADGSTRGLARRFGMRPVDYLRATIPTTFSENSALSLIPVPREPT